MTRNPERLRFGYAVKLRLAECGLTQSAVAAAMGMDLGNFNNALFGRKPTPKGFDENLEATIDLLVKAEEAANEARRRVLVGEAE